MAKNKTVLVLEDEIGTMITLCNMTRNAGYRVISCANKADALGALQNGKLDIIVTNIALPDADGIEILEIAKDIDPDIPIIIMTGYADAEKATTAVSQGAYTYFVKPINLDEMKTAIDNALKQKSLALENRRLVESLQRSNKLLLETNAELQRQIMEREEAEELYETLANSSPFGTYISQDGEFQFVNPQFESYLGLSKDKLLGTNPLMLVHPDDKEMVRESAIAMLRRNHLLPYEFRVMTGSGRTIWAMETVTSIQYKGRRATLGNLVDITERRQMEEERRQKNRQLDTQNENLKSLTQKLLVQQQELIEKTSEVQRANQLKSEFLANMSHELRTPLNVIIGFSELMVDEVPGKINDEQRQCLGDILNAGEQLLGLINDVLDLSRIESGKVELKIDNVILNEVLKSLARTMTPILAPRKQTVKIGIGKQPVPVRADRAKLEQVLLNLVDNASKFTPDGGRLRIEATREDNWCRVSVIDDGVGIKKEDLDRLFEPFSRLDSPLAKERGGTGLGLVLVKQIVEKCGGQIGVESEYGKGSRFIFTLPLAKEAPNSKAATKQ